MFLQLPLFLSMMADDESTPTPDEEVENKNKHAGLALGKLRELNK